MTLQQEVEAYIQNHTLPESTNAGLNLIERLMSRINQLEGTIHDIRDATDALEYDKY